MESSQAIQNSYKVRGGTSQNQRDEPQSSTNGCLGIEFPFTANSGNIRQVHFCSFHRGDDDTLNPDSVLLKFHGDLDKMQIHQASGGAPDSAFLTSSR